MLILMGPLRKGKQVGKWGNTLDKCRKIENKSMIPQSSTEKILVYIGRSNKLISLLKTLIMP